MIAIPPPVPQPILQPVPEKGLYRLMEDWRFSVKGVARPFTIKAGFEYDGASAPKGTWYLTYSPFNPIVQLAAVQHDALCKWKPDNVSSQQAAYHFRDHLIHANPFKRSMMFGAVWTFGPQWGKKRTKFDEWRDEADGE